MKHHLCLFFACALALICAHCSLSTDNAAKASTDTDAPHPAAPQPAAPAHQPAVWRGGDSLPAALAMQLDSCFYATPLPDSIVNVIRGVSYHDDCPVPIKDLRYVRAAHYDFNGNILQGEMICHKSIANDLVEILRQLFECHYPIERMVLIDNYMADDEASMQANNSSCFNCRRTTGGGRLSQHAYGVAVDINPLQNPYVHTSKSGKVKVAPANSQSYVKRSPLQPGMITRYDPCCQAFVSHGFRWGGDWRGAAKDFQHFERRLRR